MVAWVVAVPVLLGILLVLMYNTLVGRRNAVAYAFAGMDAVLKQRYDLIPNLVATVTEYAEHEQETLTSLTELRTRAVGVGLSADEQVAVNSEIDRGLRSLMVAVEDYPQLRASENFGQLQRALNEIEERISASRRAYNAAVTDYNNALEMFPTNLLAPLLRLTRRELFEVPEAQRETPVVGAMFTG